jgi:sulfur relay (sulfurtransferase) complex TusBCD TusD component (DsrE family)
MSSYLLIESRDPLESRAFSRRCELAIALRSDGAPVTVFLLENAVLGARAAARPGEVSKLAAAGVSVFADEFALRERGIGTDEIVAMVRPAELETVVALLAAGAKPVWN